MTVSASPSIGNVLCNCSLSNRRYCSSSSSWFSVCTAVDGWRVSRVILSIHHEGARTGLEGEVAGDNAPPTCSVPASLDAFRVCCRMNPPKLPDRRCLTVAGITANLLGSVDPLTADDEAESATIVGEEEGCTKPRDWSANCIMDAVEALRKRPCFLLRSLLFVVAGSWAVVAVDGASKR